MVFAVCRYGAKSRLVLVSAICECCGVGRRVRMPTVDLSE